MLKLFIKTIGVLMLILGISLIFFSTMGLEQDVLSFKQTFIYDVLGIVLLVVGMVVGDLIYHPTKPNVYIDNKSNLHINSANSTKHNSNVNQKTK